MSEEYATLKSDVLASLGTTAVEYPLFDKRVRDLITRLEAENKRYREAIQKMKKTVNDESMEEVPMYASMLFELGGLCDQIAEALQGEKEGE